MYSKAIKMQGRRKREFNFCELEGALESELGHALT
jgi:hypothetical protein